MPATAVPVTTTMPPPQQQSDQLALEDVVRDAHMQSIFLQYLSSHDKKGFARLLFLYVRQMDTHIALFCCLCVSLHAHNHV